MCSFKTFLSAEIFFPKVVIFLTFNSIIPAEEAEKKKIV